MSSVELIDELEAGELSVEFEGEEPQALLEWAFERFSPRIAISTAFQIDGVVLIDMAYAIDPDDPGVQRRHGPAARGDVRADRAAPRPLPGARARAALARAGAGRAMVGKHGPNLFYTQVEQRLLCCNVRKVRPLHAAPRRRSTPGSPACAATSGRAARTSARSRSTTTTARSSSSTRSPSGPRTRSGTTSASTRCPTTRSTTRATRRSAARRAPAPTAPGEASRAGRWWWESNAPKECGIHCSIETRRARARAARADRRAWLSASRSAARRARSRWPRRRRCSRWRATRRARAARRRASRPSTTARSRATTPRRSRSCSSSACRRGRMRALYGPGGEQAALALFRRLPRGARARRERARGDEALGALEGRALERSRSTAVGPARYGLTIQPEARDRRPARPGRSPARVDRSMKRRDSATTWPASTSGPPCLVVGGGRSRLEKAQGLLDCGARVTVVAPEVAPELRALPVEWSRRALQPRRPRRPLPRRRRDRRRAVNAASSATPRRAACSATSPTSPSSATSSCPPFTARARSRRRLDRRRLAGARQAAARRDRRARRAPSTPSSREQLRRAAARG